MSVAIIEDGQPDGMAGITHYKRRREELVGGAFVEGGVAGITPYKRYREERDGWRGETGWPPVETAMQSGMSGITPYKRYRDERDGWTEREGFPVVYNEMVKHEIDDGYKSAATVNGLGDLSDAVMTIEGLDFLFNFPQMPLEDMMYSTSAERELMPSTAFAESNLPDVSGLPYDMQQPGVADVPGDPQVATLNVVLDKRRAVISTSDSRMVELLRRIKDLDEKIEKMADDFNTAMKTDRPLAMKIQQEALDLDRKRGHALKRLVRFAKLRTLASNLARNVKTQIMIVDLHKNAKSRGDKTSADTFEQAFRDIGKSSDKILSIRKAQQQKWAQENTAGGLNALEAGGDPDAVRRSRILNLEADMKLIMREISGFKEIAKKRKLAPKEMKAVKNMRDRYDRLRDEWQKLKSGSGMAGLGDADGSISIPHIWTSGDLRSALRVLYGKIDTMKAQGATPSQLQPLYDKAYNLRRMVEETRGQGLSGGGLGLWPFSQIASGAKAVAGTIYSGAKTAVTAVASAGVKLGKFAACGIAAKPQFQAAAGSVPHPAGQASAIAGSVLAGACSKGPGQQMAIQESGIDASAVTGSAMDKPVVGGFKLKHLLAVGGVLAVGGTAAFLVLRKRGGMGDIYDQYGFRDVYDSYGFKTTRGV